MITRIAWWAYTPRNATIPFVFPTKIQSFPVCTLLYIKSPKKKHHTRTITLKRAHAIDGKVIFTAGTRVCATFLSYVAKLVQCAISVGVALCKNTRNEEFHMRNCAVSKLTLLRFTQFNQRQTLDYEIFPGVQFFLNRYTTTYVSLYHHVEWLFFLHSLLPYMINTVIQCVSSGGQRRIEYTFELNPCAWYTHFRV